jgi:histidine phosphotransfer protein HptB
MRQEDKMDFMKLADRLGLELEEFIELVDLFITTGSSDLEKLINAAEQEDFSGVIQFAHTIKGASGNLGFEEIYEIAAEMEHKARDNSIEDVAVSGEKIRQMIERIDKMVKSMEY